MAIEEKARTDRPPAREEVIRRMCTSEQLVSAQDALSMIDTALDYLATADMHRLDTAGQAQALTALGRITARTSAVHAAALAASPSSPATPIGPSSTRSSNSPSPGRAGPTAARRPGQRTARPGSGHGR
jgi:hypothetical protein